MGTQLIHVMDLTVAYPKGDGTTHTALSSLDLSIEEGEFVSLLGPSGCGKTTLLMALDGLVTPAVGKISIRDRVVTGPGPDRAVVFQQASLLPWRTVRANVAFAFEALRKKPSSHQDRIDWVLHLVGLSDFADFRPGQLSGGMQQRVGLARALAIDPDILLMDEPFGALDAQTRELMGYELLEIWNATGKTIVFVTHDIDEALLLSDRIVVMGTNPGRIKEIINVDLERPRTDEVRGSKGFAKYRAHIWEQMGARVPGASA